MEISREEFIRSFVVVATVLGAKLYSETVNPPRIPISPPLTPEESGALNRKEAAKYLSVSTSTLHALVASGSIKQRQLPGITRPRYLKADLDKYLKSKKG